jgi:hypothetical protein
MSLSPCFRFFPMTHFLLSREPWLIVPLSYSRWGDEKSTAQENFFISILALHKNFLSCGFVAFLAESLGLSGQVAYSQTREAKPHA